MRRRGILHAIAVAGVLAAALPAGVARASSYTVTLSASPTSVPAGQSTTLTATTNRDVSLDGLSIEIFDEVVPSDTTRWAYVASCTAGTTCSTGVSLPQTASRTHTYVAVVSQAGTTWAPPGIQATSSTATVTWQLPWRQPSNQAGPAARFGAAMAFDPAAGVTVLFGGCTALTSTTFVITLKDGSVHSIPGGFCAPAAQRNDVWLWNGSTETWSQVTPSGTPPFKRWSPSMAYDYKSGRLVVFGGLYQTDQATAPGSGDAENCYQQDTNDDGVPGVQSVQDGSTGRSISMYCFMDTWTLSQVGGVWTWQRLSTAGQPESRFDAGMAFDGAGIPTLVGGCHRMGMIGTHVRPDIPSTWDCTDYAEVEREVANDCVLPPGELQEIVCGGHDVYNVETWHLTWTANPSSGGTPVWTQVGCLSANLDPSGLCGPTPLRGATVTFDPVTRHVLLEGGYFFEPHNSYGGFLADTYEFDGDHWTRQLSQGGMDKWCPSLMANKAWGTTSPLYLNGHWQVLSHGGLGRYFTSDTTCPNSWSKLEDRWYDPSSPTLLSRPTATQAWGDTWRNDSTQCLPVGSANNTGMCWFPLGDASPGARNSAMMAFDNVHGKAVLFGGICGGCLSGLGDTWVFDAGTATDPCGSTCGTYTPVPTTASSTSWTEQSPLLAPSARWGASSTWDAARSQVVLFGGCTGSNPCSGASNETWVWDGSSWTRKLPLHSPPARLAAALAWDSVAQVAVLYGGISSSGSSASLLADTWTWDGSDWTQKLVSGPGGLGWAGMATDSTGRSVLYGGCSSLSGNTCTGYSAATSRWNGSAWTSPCGTGCTAPPARMVTGQLAADHGGRVLLFGGYDGGWRSDTWSWDGAANTWAQFTPAVAPTARSGAAMVPVLVNGSWVVMLSGGATATGLVTDIWFFTYTTGGGGGVWSQDACSPPPCAAPPARQLTAVAAGAATGHATLFGGLGGVSGPVDGDTWVF